MEGQVQVSFVRIAGHQLSTDPSVAKRLIESTARRTRMTDGSFNAYATTNHE